MARAWTERPPWQRWLIVSGWLFLGLVVLLIVVGESEDASPEARAQELTDWTGDVQAAGAPCDAAVQGMIEGMQTLAAGGDGNAMTGYQAAYRVEQACKTAWRAMRDLETPAGLAAEAEQAAADAAETCATSFFARGEMGEAVAAVYDGDLSPSAQTHAGEQIRSAGQLSLTCAAALEKLE